MADMRVVVYDRYGPPEVLHVAKATIPAVRSGEVLVRVRGASVNGIDAIVRSGKLRFLTGSVFPRRSGLDFAGEVVTTDAAVSRFKSGDHVWGLVPEKTFGSLADFVSVPDHLISPSPAGLDLLSAAALPVVGCTAIIALRDIAKLKSGERLLVRGASGGVGAAAVQIARCIGAHVTALASAATRDRLQGLGADRVLDYAVAVPSELGRFDVILDTVGSDTHSFRRLLINGGRMMTTTPDPRRPMRSMMYFLSSWVYGGRRVRFFSARPDSALLADLAKYVERGAIKPLIDTIYPIQRSDDAHRAMEAGGRQGKQVVDLQLV